MKFPKISFPKNAPLILLGAFFLISFCQAEEKTAPPEASPASQIRFLSYNLENYLTMDIYRKGGVKEERSKDPAEIKALVEIIVSEKPDILGICEIGTLADLAELQEHLKKAGLDLPHTVHAGGDDKVRHLAILSKLPIVENNSQSKLPIAIDGYERLMGRGILSVVINLPNGPTHFVGLHLKSKRPLADFDQAAIRLSEARHAKAHCDAILTADPEARVVLYGDMNDTRKTPPISALLGRSNSKKHLADVFVKDSRDQLWTHYWEYQQLYSRLDYVLASRSVHPEIDMEHSYISDPPNWNEASDHRPIMTTFNTKP